MDKVQHEYNNLKQVMNNKMEKQILNPMSNKHVFPQCANTMNFMTQKGHMDLQGYDVSGCRLDGNKTNQNGSMYGPPLAWCDTYDKSKMQKTGTLWYPLN